MANKRGGIKGSLVTVVQVDEDAGTQEHRRNMRTRVVHWKHVRSGGLWDPQDSNPGYGSFQILGLC